MVPFERTEACQSHRQRLCAVDGLERFNQEIPPAHPHGEISPSAGSRLRPVSTMEMEDRWEDGKISTSSIDRSDVR